MEQFENGELAESTVDIKEHAYLIWSWAWLIVLAGILAGAAAYAVSVRTTPIYEATTKLLVSAPSAISGVDPTSLVTTQTMTSTYSQMLLDRPVLQGVIDQLQLSTTPEDLKKLISVDVVTNTQLLVITAQDPDPKRAAHIANMLAAVCTVRIRELQSQRYSASREGLAAQVSDMERQITATGNQIAAIQQQVAAAGTRTAELAFDPNASSHGAIPPVDTAGLEQLQARLTQYRTIYSSLVTSFEQVRLSEEQTSTNVVVSEPAAINVIPAMVSCAIWIGLGSRWLVELASGPVAYGGAATGCAIVVLLVLRGILGVPGMDLSRDRSAEDFAGSILASAPNNAILVTHGDESTFALWYRHYALHRRPDVSVVSDDLFAQAWYRKVLTYTYVDLVVPSDAWTPALALARANPRRPVCAATSILSPAVDCAGRVRRGASRMQES